MDFLDVVDVFFLFSSDKEEKKRSRGPKDGFNVFIILFSLGTLVWCVFEIWKVIELSEPVLFVLVFSGIGFLLTIVVMVVVWRLDWIEYVTPLNFISYLLPIVLISVAAASFMNRVYAKERVIEGVVASGSDNDSFMLKSPVVKEIHLHISKGDYPDLRQGDSIQLKYSEGLLGFDRMKEVKPAFQNGED